MTLCSWKDVRYERQECGDSRVQRYLSAVATAYTNGGAECATLVATDPNAFDLACKNDLPGTDKILMTLLNSSSVAEGVPELQLVQPVEDELVFCSLGTYAFEGSLVDILIGGGYFGKFVGTVDVARSLSRDCVNALTHDATLSGSIWRLHGAWAPWFQDAGLDFTFILFDRKARSWTLLLFTDSDLKASWRS